MAVNYVREDIIIMAGKEGFSLHERRDIIARDISNYRIKLCAIQETHLSGTGSLIIAHGNDKYNLFYHGGEKNSHHGVGIISAFNIKCNYRAIGDRIVLAKCVGNDKTIAFISACAPSLGDSEKKTQKNTWRGKRQFL